MSPVFGDKNYEKLEAHCISAQTLIKQGQTAHRTAKENKPTQRQRYTETNEPADTQALYRQDKMILTLVMYNLWAIYE